MRNKTSAKDLANKFASRIDNDNIISDVFDEVGFDCSVRCFADPNELDEAIRLFYKSKSVERLTAVIEIILKGKNAASTNEKKLLNDIKHYIIENLSDNITIEQIAGRLHISYYYLSHLFKKMSGQSLNQFRTTKRLEGAIRMLLESDAKISDIALAYGFDNLSYFSETFAKHIGETPSNFRKNHADCVLHSFYDLDDMLLALKMPSARFLGKLQNVYSETGLPYVQVHNPGDEFGYFLHEAAIIEYEGILYASWYNCKKRELVGYTPIVGRRSCDGGKTWTVAEIIAEDKSEKILYCPPVYGICGGKLYMLINQMVSADHMHSLDLYVLNKETDRFELLWSRPIPFKLNTNVVRLPNGKLILPGRIAELDGFPNTPAVMISDSGEIDAEWRVVKVAKNGDLPDGSSLVHPETTLICCDDILYLFNRNDCRNVPLVYISRDFGESWSEAMAHDIPYRSTKIYSGVLSDGRFFLIANTDRDNRSRLVLYVSERGRLKFTKEKLLIDCEATEEKIIKCHYPAAVEADGKLYVIATADYDEEDTRGRGAILFAVDLKSI